MNCIHQKVLNLLNHMNISYEYIEHPPVYTIEDMDNLNLQRKNEIVKNLFLRDDKKKRYFLIVLQKDKKVDLKEIRRQLDCRPLSFASEESLLSILDLRKGSVTPFGIINDKDSKVEVVFDKDVMSFDRIGVHPNNNEATVWVHPMDLELVIRKQGNTISYID